MQHHLLHGNRTSFKELKGLAYNCDDEVRNTIGFHCSKLTSGRNCFYRNNKHVADERSYVTDGKRELKTVSVELVSTSGGYPTFSEVTLLTEYLFTASAVTDSNHVCTFRFETYENDMVKRLRISHGGNTIEKEVSLDIDSGGPHRVMIS